MGHYPNGWFGRLAEHSRHALGKTDVKMNTLNAVYTFLAQHWEAFTVAGAWFAKDWKNIKGFQGLWNWFLTGNTVKISAPPPALGVDKTNEPKTTETK